MDELGKDINILLEFTAFPDALKETFEEHQAEILALPQPGHPFGADNNLGSRSFVLAVYYHLVRAFSFASLCQAWTNSSLRIFFLEISYAVQHLAAPPRRAHVVDSPGRRLHPKLGLRSFRHLPDDVDHGTPLPLAPC